MIRHFAIDIYFSSRNRIGIKREMHDEIIGFGIAVVGPALAYDETPVLGFIRNRLWLRYQSRETSDGKY